MQTLTIRHKRMAPLTPLNYRIHDLTKIISPEMQVYPGDPQPKFEQYLKLENDGANVTRIVLGSHTGTHVDAQWHFLQDGKGAEKEPLTKFIGEAVVIDVTSKPPGEGITADDLNHADAKKNDILLLYTGRGERRTDFTYVDVSAAEWVVNHGIKCIGIDTLSVEKYGRKDAPVHKILLSNDIGIIENLDSSLKQFAGKRTFLVCLPLPLEGVDGSPARVILLETIK
jgi:arylformamidase